jgi:hypothetical protein
MHSNIPVDILGKVSNWKNVIVKFAIIPHITAIIGLLIFLVVSICVSRED